MRRTAPPPLALWPPLGPGLARVRPRASQRPCHHRGSHGNNWDAALPGAPPRRRPRRAGRSGVAVSTAWKVTLYSAAALTVVLCGLGALVVVAVTAQDGCATPRAGSTRSAGPGGWSDEQIGNAGTIVAVGA